MKKRHGQRERESERVRDCWSAALASLLLAEGESEHGGGKEVEEQSPCARCGSKPSLWQRWPSAGQVAVQLSGVNTQHHA